MTWAVQTQFNTLNPNVGATEVPEWMTVRCDNETDARQMLRCVLSGRTWANRVVTLWCDDEVVETFFN